MFYSKVRVSGCVTRRQHAGPCLELDIELIDFVGKRAAVELSESVKHERRAHVTRAMGKRRECNKPHVVFEGTSCMPYVRRLLHAPAGQPTPAGTLAKRNCCPGQRNLLFDGIKWIGSGGSHTEKW